VRLEVASARRGMVSVNAMHFNRRTRKDVFHRQWCKSPLIFLPFLLATLAAIVWRKLLFPAAFTNNAFIDDTHAYTTDRRRLEFVHITKTGGSAIEKIGADNSIMWGACHYMNITEVGCLSPDIAYIAPNYQSYALTSPWHTPPKILHSVVTVNEPYTGADLFTVVRNPYSRIVSEYYCPYTGFRRKGINNGLTMNNWISNTVRKLDKVLSDYSVQNPNDRPKEQSRNHNEDPVLLAQKHMVNQIEYVFEKGVQVIDHVIHYENIQEEFNNLMEIYGLDLKLPNKESHGVNTRGKNSKLSHFDLFPETIAIINKYAADDFTMFGYEMVDKFQDDGKYSLSATSNFTGKKIQ